MPSSTPDRPRTRAHPSDWVVVVPGQQPDGLPESTESAAAKPQVRRAATAARLARGLAAGLSTVLHSAVGRLALMVGVACAAVAVLGLLAGRDPLLALGLTR